VTVLPGTFSDQLVRSERAVSIWGFDVVRVVLGCILLTAAVLKGWQLATEQYHSEDLSPLLPRELITIELLSKRLTLQRRLVMDFTVHPVRSSVIDPL